MRALILSDTHGYVGKLQDALFEAGDCDVIVHLGDGVRDLSALRGYVHADVLAVRGNNDLFAGDIPDSRVVTVGEVRLFCTHGHLYGVRSDRTALARAAKKEGCAYALYGHTHILADETIEGVRCLNPGSIGYPMGKRAVLEVTATHGDATFRFVEV